MKKIVTFLMLSTFCICLLAGCGTASKLIGQWTCFAAERNGERYNASDTSESLLLEFVDTQTVKQIANDKIETYEYRISDNTIIFTNNGLETKYKYVIKEITGEKLTLYYEKKGRLLYFKKTSDTAVKA